MAAAEDEEPEPNSWQEALQKMLPKGAPLMDEDHLDYSISFDYIGPSPYYKKPTNPIIPKTRFTTFPRQAWLNKSHSSSDTTISDNNKRLSISSVVAASEDDDDNNNDDDDDGDDEVAGDHDRDNDHNRNLDKSNRKRGSCVVSVGKKGRDCGRCGKGSIGLFRRERCIVCGAVYCKKCVVKAMGSMPEGRKCVGCIGKPIDEANRGRLGKGGSWVLGRVCDGVEVKRIMRMERECRANRVRPEQVVVNGRELREQELDELLNCAVPVRGLRPGRYWYDKDSGLWGKEGEKPDRIVSSKLDVGGKLQSDASRGDTKVYMNGREITKAELQVLKLAKVQCPRNTHFWLYEDGSYEEEGQNNIKGYIWEKASTRLLSSLFSLPVPNESARCTKVEEPASFSAGLFHTYLEQNNLQKLLLLGLEGAGISTIFKQAKLIYTNKFTNEELQHIKLIIQSNLYRYFSILLEGREHFEEEALTNRASSGPASESSVSGGVERDGSRQCIYSVNQRISNFSDWFLDLMATGGINTYFPAAAREYAPIIDEIWKDPAIQDTYKRREELTFLPDVAKYFLDRVIEISSNEYEPSEKDILLAEGVTPSNGLSCIEFSFDDCSVISQLYDRNYEGELSLSKYQLIQLSSKGRTEGCKWLEMFEGMGAVIICVSLNDYDQLWINSNGLQQNKMLASRDFFESVIQQSCFEDTPFLLLLNKYDLFEDKINRVPLTACEWFWDFNPLRTTGRTISLAHKAYHYVAAKFKELYGSVTGRKLYVCQTCAIERMSVDGVFRYVREIVEWEEEKGNGDVYAVSMSDEDSISGEGMNNSPSSQ